MFQGEPGHSGEPGPRGPRGDPGRDASLIFSAYYCLNNVWVGLGDKRYHIKIAIKFMSNDGKLLTWINLTVYHTAEIRATTVSQCMLLISLLVLFHLVYTFSVFSLNIWRHVHISRAAPRVTSFHNFFWEKIQLNIHTHTHIISDFWSNSRDEVHVFIFSFIETADTEKLCTMRKRYIVIYFSFIQFCWAAFYNGKHII